jgi:hypothetical protein
MNCCGRYVERCPYKRQVTTVNQVRDQCLQMCYSDPRFLHSDRDMYSSPCGKFCQKVVDQTLLQYGYFPCQKKIQPAVHWYT